MPERPKFHLFPALPSELRLKIWATICTNPRTVSLKCKRNVQYTRRFAESFRTRVPSPAVLQVCRESRAEGLRIYQRYFETDRSPRYTYLSFSSDRVKLHDTALTYLGPKELAGIERMVLDVRDCAYFGHFHIDIIKRMTRLRELEIFVQEGEVYRCPRYGIYLHSLSGDFQDARAGDPEWDCPHVRILKRGKKEDGEREEIVRVLGGKCEDRSGKGSVLFKTGLRCVITQIQECELPSLVDGLVMFWVFEC
ncbi:uncharacterized protein BP5553_10456 [Venustampulla echinocandica]|uniref:2EXR domain-containing protein n=1 Tax=Venustampulla echinocandica TaxID=2656787 RepID=A0A370T9D6_9HELO|nr:uncharacterized protein BP5553_10456 [Venustampulla echinocandica]RDL30178.1 hypothetical protein BP5553_10456 [Venustampulla echinocandica]